MVTTRNRKDELRVALQSAVQQTAKPEIIVIDDGSTDGTSEMVYSEFRQVKLVQHGDSRGYITRRNEGARLARGEIVFSIDDDAEFMSPNTVAQTLTEFDDQRIGAVAIPFVEPKKGGRVMQRAPGEGRTWITDCYVGTAHAVRRDWFVRLGAYREQLVHQGEERDFCIRLLAAGGVVRLGRADVIHHYESPKRDMTRMDYYGRRNDILFAWHLVPMPFLPLHVVATTLNGIFSAWESRRPVRMAQGMLSGYAACFREWSERLPVPVPIYRLHRRLKKAGPCPLEEIISVLPPLASAEFGARVTGGC